ncbi:MAG: (2Fe-2S)-binding protein [Leptospiraceae bacterium]|nr:(2Fe-2S)-binding protein [Leptospiraceae bacterium]
MRPKRVCLCRQVGEEELVQAIHSGCDTMAKLVERTLATTGCGTCANSVKSILERETAKINRR